MTKRSDWTPERREQAAEMCRKRAKHNKRHLPEYSVWVGMRRRCKSRKGYADKGITVCERWNDFEVFLADMGPRPSPEHTIDRIEGREGYRPDNCRWATPIEQANNLRTNKIVVFRNQETTRLEAWRTAGEPISRQTYTRRLSRGWNVADALFKPRKLDHTCAPKGERFHRLTVIGYCGRTQNKSSRVLWRFRCDCGAEKIAPAHSVLGGYIKSCGCLQREARRQNGLAVQRLRKIARAA